ncbi:MAG: helix-turn-helix domain-containing protein [Methanomassiliicoccaceae archaeon]|nr:helix-turn-helix domain-containing protein [Methanomassiliicoccaceae archaeon]
MEQYADLYFISDVEIMRRIGKKIRTVRLNSNITREELQRITGVHKKTIGDAESGKNVTMGTFIAILRGLQILEQAEELIRDDGPSPVMMAKLQGNIPQRARVRK